MANLNITWKLVQFEHIKSHQHDKNGWVLTVKIQCGGTFADLCSVESEHALPFFFLSLNILASVNIACCLGSHTLSITK